MFNFFRRIHVNGGLFNGHYVDVKALYVAKFNKIPCLTFIGDLDVSKTLAFVNETYKADIKATYQHSYFNHDDKKVYFNNTVIVLSFERVIEIANNYCQLLHTPLQYRWAYALVNDLAQFKVVIDNTASFKHTHVVGFAKEAEMN